MAVKRNVSVKNLVPIVSFRWGCGSLVLLVTVCESSPLTVLYVVFWHSWHVRKIIYCKVILFLRWLQSLKSPHFPAIGAGGAVAPCFIPKYIFFLYLLHPHLPDITSLSLLAQRAHRKFMWNFLTFFFFKPNYISDDFTLASHFYFQCPEWVLAH